MSGQESETAVPPGVRTMAVVRWVLVAAMGFAAVASTLHFAGYSLTRGRAASGPRAKVYYCPMHPQVQQDHPGECPICSMTLVPKPDNVTGVPSPMVGMTKTDAGTAVPTKVAESAGVPGLVPVELSPERIQLMGMRTAKVTRETVAAPWRTVGVIAANERGLAQIATRYTGYIEKLAVAETGQRVRKGQVLATVYSPEVLRAQQELLTAKRWKDAESATPAAASMSAAPHDRHALTGDLDLEARRRLELLGVSSTEIEEMIRSGKPTAALAVRSPVDGYVIAKNAVAGGAVAPGAPLFEVADLSTVWVIAEIHEADVARVRLGQTATLELPSYPGESFKGKVQFVYPTVDPATRTLRVRLDFRNRTGAAGPILRPGMSGHIDLALPTTTSLMVPTESVVDTGEAQYVFVVKEGGRFEPRRVRSGASVADKTAITSGLAEGETVVSTANFLIDSESRLRAAIEGR